MRVTISCPSAAWVRMISHSASFSLSGFGRGNAGQGQSEEEARHQADQDTRGQDMKLELRTKK